MNWHPMPELTRKLPRLGQPARRVACPRQKVRGETDTAAVDGMPGRGDPEDASANVAGVTGGEASQGEDEGVASGSVARAIGSEVPSGGGSADASLGDCTGAAGARSELKASAGGTMPVECAEVRPSTIDRQRLVHEGRHEPTPETIIHGLADAGRGVAPEGKGPWPFA